MILFLFVCFLGNQPMTFVFGLMFELKFAFFIVILTIFYKFSKFISFSLLIVY